MREMDENLELPGVELENKVIKEAPAKQARRWNKKAAIGIIALLAIAGAVIAMWPTPVSYIDDAQIYPGTDCIKDVNSFFVGGYKGLLVNGIPECVFANVPEKPDRFGPTMSLVQAGEIKVEDFCTRLNESFWKQPDFYPNSGALYDSYINPSRDADGTLRRGVYGYGSYISELLAGVSPGDKFSSCVYIHTAPFISTFQGLAFSAKVYGGNGSSIVFKQDHFSDGTTGTGNIDYSRYFTVNIEPRYILLEPAFPYIYGNWSQKVRLDIIVAPNTPPGKYMLVMSPSGQIPSEIDSEWSWKYLTSYMRGTGFYQDILMIGVEVS
jgi:hypothetical protein